MKLRILAGVYGHNEHGRVRPVRPGDPPIEVKDSIGARLIKAGVAAEIVEQIPENASIEGANQESDAADDTFPDYDNTMTRQQLEEIALDVGIEPEELKAAKNKAAVIALLDEAREAFDEDDELPDLDPAGAIE